MLEIALESIELENFKSYKEKTIVRLSTTPGFKYLGGDNKAEPRLGANGAGKSTLWDAVVWCLFGTSAKGLRASELASWGETAISATTRWHINGYERIVHRQGNPNKLFMDGEPVEQCDIDAVFMSRTRFLHSVIFGQKVDLFPDLDMGKRAALLDDVLNLGVWLDKAKRAGDICAELDAAITKHDRELARAEGTLQGIDAGGLEKLYEDEAEWEGKQEEHLALCQRNLEQSQEKVRIAEEAFNLTGADLPYEKKWAKLELEIEAHKTALGKTTLAHQRVKDGIKDTVDRINFYIDHENCPTCKQGMSDGMREKESAALNATADSLEEEETRLHEERARLVHTIKTLREESDAIQTKRNRLAATRNGRKIHLALAKQDVAAKKQAVTQAAEGQDNPYSHRIKSLENALKRAKGEFNTAKKAKAGLEKQRALADYWRVGFKRVRLYMIRETLAYLELETSNAAQSLGLVNWKIFYATETETKSGTTKHGVQITVSSPKASASWESWSGGENQRIRLAVAHGLSMLIQNMSGVRYGFEVYDEPSAWLSEQGITDMLATLANRARVLDRSVWLCDHRSLDRASFAETWMVTKKRTGSSVVKL